MRQGQTALASAVGLDDDAALLPSPYPGPSGTCRVTSVPSPSSTPRTPACPPPADQATKFYNHQVEPTTPNDKVERPLSVDVEVGVRVSTLVELWTLTRTDPPVLTRMGPPPRRGAWRVQQGTIRRLWASPGQATGGRWRAPTKCPTGPGPREKYTDVRPLRRGRTTPSSPGGPGSCRGPGALSPSGTSRLKPA